MDFLMPVEKVELGYDVNANIKWICRTEFRWLDVCKVEK